MLTIYSVGENNEEAALWRNLFAVRSLLNSRELRRNSWLHKMIRLLYVTSFFLFSSSVSHRGREAIEKMKICLWMWVWQCDSVRNTASTHAHTQTITHIPTRPHPFSSSIARNTTRWRTTAIFSSLGYLRLCWLLSSSSTIWTCFSCSTTTKIISLWRRSRRRSTR